MVAIRNGFSEEIPSKKEAGKMQHKNKLREILTHPKTLFSVRLLLGIVFLISSFGKILDPQSFAENLVAYQLIPSPQWVKYIAVTFPWVEWFCGVFLLLGIFTRSVAILSSGMFLSFIAAMSTALFRGLKIHCGCFTSGGEIIGSLSLVRDLFFLALSLTVTFADPDIYTLQQVLTRRRRREREEFT
jgi:putative oxidoreductase